MPPSLSFSICKPGKNGPPAPLRLMGVLASLLVSGQGEA